METSEVVKGRRRRGALLVFDLRRLFAKEEVHADDVGVVGTEAPAGVGLDEAPDLGAVGRADVGEVLDGPQCRACGRPSTRA